MEDREAWTECFNQMAMACFKNSSSIEELECRELEEAAAK
jgi:hypothetical protein